MRTDQAYPTHSEEVVLAVSLELAASKWKKSVLFGGVARAGRSSGAF
jgi:hypothetical protein